MSKTNQLRTAEQLPDRALLVAHKGLVEQDALFVPALEPTLDDLVQSSGRFALVAYNRRRGLAHVVDLLGRHILTPYVLRTGERDVESDVVSQRLVGSDCFHENGVHSPTVLQVPVAADDGGLRGLKADGLAECDVLLRDELQVLDPVRTLCEPFLTVQGEPFASSSTSETNSADFATKSVSHSSITIAPVGT